MNEYIEQAKKFLTETETCFKIEYLRTGPYFNDDKEYRDIYQFTLTNKKGNYSSTFGDSIHNTERRIFASTNQPFFSFKHDAQKAKKLGFHVSDEIKFKAKLIAARHHKPSSYDILACLSTYVEPIFDDWLNVFGYDSSPVTEYLKLREIHDNCLRESQALARMFTPEQLEQLQGIK